ncbi:pyridoxine 5'-phosphate oxidase C-terminal domain-containing protein, partial [Escherichia coli]|nr:pyridoxine 5'-phosphate oxidase C-terminal domain-containing protein [Escherichia coli]
EVKVKNLEEEFAGKVITRPAYWSGYLVKPYEKEFWHGRPNRLHDRIRFQYRENTWKKDRLSS